MCSTSCVDKFSDILKFRKDILHPSAFCLPLARKSIRVSQDCLEERIEASSIFFDQSDPYSLGVVQQLLERRSTGAISADLRVIVELT